jgi:hypothetical protein
MQQLFDLIDVEFTEAEIREIASEFEARCEALLASSLFLPVLVAVGVIAALWVNWRAF